MKKEKISDCFQCKHFFTTWNPQYPRGCREFGFKGKEIPSRLMYDAVKGPCPGFEKKSSLQ